MQIMFSEAQHNLDDIMRQIYIKVGQDILKKNKVKYIYQTCTCSVDAISTDC